MDQHEKERLATAHCRAQLLCEDLRQVQAKTDCVALEELMLTGIEQVAHISRVLGRLAGQK